MAITQKPFPPRPVQNGGNKPQQGMRGKRVEKENPNRINEEITAPTVRLVGENVEPNTVVSLREALAMADEMELDLIEISPKADPPVCRIADYQKFLYQLKRKAKEIKAKQVKIVIKEIRLVRRPTTTTTTSNSSTPRTSSRRVQRLRHRYSSVVALSYSRSRERFCCCALLPTWRRLQRLRLCLNSMARR